MRVIMFQPQFHSPVLTGVKRSTIRRKGKRRSPLVGEPLSLRKWLGMPYRSRQAILSEPTCTCVRPIELGLSSRGNWWVIRRNDGAPCLLNADERRELALVEGFQSEEQMRDWFVANHKLTPGVGIEGVQIEW